MKFLFRATLRVVSTLSSTVSIIMLSAFLASFFVVSPAGASLTQQTVSYPDPVGAEVGPTIMGTGEIFPTHVDLAVPGRGLGFIFSRTYRHIFFRDSDGFDISPITEDWTHSYHWWIDSTNDNIAVITGDGMMELFGGTGDPLPGVRATLTNPGEDIITYTTKDKIRYKFKKMGFYSGANDHKILQLIEISAPPYDPTTTITLHYTTGSYKGDTMDKTRRLQAVKDTLGRIAWLTYTASDQLSKLEFGIGDEINGLDPEQILYTVHYNLAASVTYDLDGSDPRGLTLQTSYEYNGPAGRLSAVQDLRGVRTEYWYWDISSPPELSDGKIQEIKAILVGGETISLRSFEYGENMGCAYTLEGAIRKNELVYATNIESDVNTVTNKASGVSNVTTHSYWDMEAPEGGDRNRTLVSTQRVGGVYLKITGFKYDDVLNGGVTSLKRGNVAIAVEYEIDTLPDPTAEIPATPGADELRRSELEYNTDNQVTKRIDPMQHETVYEYFSATHKRLKKVTETETGTQNYPLRLDNELITAYTYDDVGTLITASVRMTGGEPDRVTSYDYFDYGSVMNAYLKRVSNTVTVDGVQRTLTTAYEYDMDRGLRTKVIDANGVETRSEYYEDRKLKLGTRVSDGRTTEYVYDQSGNLTLRTVEDADGTALFQANYDYDALSRLKATDEWNDDTATSINPGVGAAKYGTTTYEYDSRGNLTELTDARQNAIAEQQMIPPLKTLYDYDDLSRLTKITYTNGDWIEYGYDDLNNKTEEWTSQWGWTPTTGPPAIKYEYDDLQRLEKIIYENDPANNYVSFTYDANGNRLSMTTSDPDDGESAYTYDYQYDQVNRLRDEENGLLEDIEYTYDDASNLRTLDIGNEYDVSFDYDEINRFIGVTDFQAGKQADYRYHDGGQLQRVDFPNGAATDYEIDPANRIKNIYHRSSVQAMRTLISPPSASENRQVPPVALRDPKPEPIVQKPAPPPRSPEVAAMLTDSRIPQARILEMEDRIRNMRAMGVRKLKALYLDRKQREKEAEEAKPPEKE